MSEKGFAQLLPFATFFFYIHFAEVNFLVVLATMTTSKVVTHFCVYLIW